MNTSSLAQQIMQRKASNIEARLDESVVKVKQALAEFSSLLEDFGMSKSEMDQALIEILGIEKPISVNKEAEVVETPASQEVLPAQPSVEDHQEPVPQNIIPSFEAMPTEDIPQTAFVVPVMSNPKEEEIVHKVPVSIEGSTAPLDFSMQENNLGQEVGVGPMVQPQFETGAGDIPPSFNAENSEQGEQVSQSVQVEQNSAKPDFSEYKKQIAQDDEEDEMPTQTPPQAEVEQPAWGEGFPQSTEMVLPQMENMPVVQEGEPHASEAPMQNGFENAGTLGGLPQDLDEGGFPVPSEQTEEQGAPTEEQEVSAEEQEGKTLVHGLDRVRSLWKGKASTPTAIFAVGMAGLMSGAMTSAATMSLGA